MLGGRFGYFYVFQLGEGNGRDRFFIENPRRRRGGFQEDEGPRGREGVCGELVFFVWGGGLNFFFGAETSAK